MRFVLKRLNLFLIFTLLFAGQLFSQDEDISIENISIVGGEPLCPSSSVQFTVTIKNNDGTPSLKDVTRMNPGGNNDRDRENDKSNSENNADQNSNERPKPTVERIISKDLEQVNQFTCKKVVTKISSSSGVFTIVEWITEDTLIVNYADSVQRDLVESYGGTLSPQPSSSSWVSRIEPKKKHEVVNGKIIKSSMTSINEKGKPSFSMQMEILSAKEVDFNPLMFIVPKNYRKVDELE